jgi:hypothetical protein
MPTADQYHHIQPITYPAAKLIQESIRKCFFANSEIAQQTNNGAFKHIHFFGSFRLLTKLYTKCKGKIF